MKSISCGVTAGSQWRSTASRSTAFEADRRPDAELAARGLQVIRLTWRQIMEELEAVLVRLVQALAARDRAG
jgi:very-short-patch-repair endonuclease